MNAAFLKKIMILLTGCVTLLASFSAHAQRNVFHFSAPPAFRQSSWFTYVYAIPTDSVKSVVYGYYDFQPDAPWMQRPVYIIPNGRIDSLLAAGNVPAGHYFFVTADKGQVFFSIREKAAFSVLVADIDRVKVLSIRDTADRELNNLPVMLGKKLIPYDAGMRGYVLQEFANEEIISIRLGSYIKFLVCSVTGTDNEQHIRPRNEAREEDKRSRTFSGYLVTNKPIYQPNDTVKWKAYLEDPYQKNKLAREPLRVTFTEQYGGKTYNIAAKYRPEEPGVYFGEFVIGDSVKMDRVYDLEVYGTQSGMHLQQAFKTEDYLLEETHLRVTGEGRKLYQQGDSVNLYTAAYNSNNLPILDGQISMTVVPLQYNQSPKEQVFIPDTLYHITLPVNPEGETNIGFSTKNFYSGLRSVSCYVTVVNSNNEHADTSFTINFTEEVQYISIHEEGNTVIAELIRNKKSVPGRGTVYSQAGSYRIIREIPITYPYTYTVTEQTAIVTFTVKDDTGKLLSRTDYSVRDAQLTGLENFRGDTAVLEIFNPQGVFYRYAIYSGKDFLGYGYTTKDTTIKVYSPKGKTVSVIGAYLWKGNTIPQRFNIYKLDRDLEIDLRKKDFIYPGQRDTISVSLSNKDGKPIPRTNVTVLAFNSQFTQDYTPDLPYGGYLWPAYETQVRRSISGMSIVQYSGTKIATKEWLRRCGADTIFFYKNLYLLPDDVAWVTYDLPNSVRPQVGIYIRKGFAFFQPEIIYINDEPVYYKNATGPSHAGFFAQQGRNSVRIRMAEGEYRIDNFYMRPGMKRDMYLNIDSTGDFYYKDSVKGKEITRRRTMRLDTVVRKTAIATILQNYEQDVLRRSLLWYRPEGSDYSGRDDFYSKRDSHRMRPEGPGYSGRDGWKSFGPPQFFQGVVQVAAPTGTGYGNDNNATLIGPFNFNDSISFFQRQNTKLRFVAERDYIFTFRPGMMRVEKVFNYSWLNSPLSDRSVWPTGDYVAPNPDNYDSLIVSPQTPPETVETVAPRQVNSKAAREEFTLLTTNNLSEGNASARVSISNRGDNNMQFIAYHGQQLSHPGEAGAAANPVYILQAFYHYQPVKVLPGKYQVLIFWKNGHYSQYDSIQLREGGTTILALDDKNDRGFFNVNKPPKWLRPFIALKANSVPITAGNQQTEQWNRNEARYLKSAGSGIRGVLKDDKGNPIVNAGVQLTQRGSVRGGDLTDFDGNYNINSLNAGFYDLRFSYVGKELNITGIELKANQTIIINGKLNTTSALKDVTVRSSRGYPIIDMASPGGSATRSAEQIERSPTRSSDDFNAFRGNVYSYNSGSEGNGLSIAGSRNSGTKYIIDGVQLAPGSANFLSSPGAGPDISDYLEKAGYEQKSKGLFNRNSDKSKAFFSNFVANMMGASGLRKSFRDWAIWEPNLWTDRDGIATFTASYPDNLTSWKTYVLAMNRDGYSGRIIRLTRAFKPLSAQLSAPRFLRYGDTAEAIGKVANYTKEAFNLRSTFMQGNLNKASDTMTIHNTRVQILQVTAPAENSLDTAQLPVSFSITADNGYNDGELRSLPILPVGVTESKGDFIYLDSDTSIVSMPDSTAGHFSGRTRVHVDGSLLEVMLREVADLKTDAHGCNEQLTTKLLAIYYEEAIKKMLGRTDFNNTETRKKILDQLVRAQRTDGGFGWWSGNNIDDRITNYIISTMQKVNGDGWLDYIIRRGVNYLDRHLKDMSPQFQIVSMQTLSAAGFAANYKPLLDHLDSTKQFSLYDRLAMIKIRKEQKLPYRAALDTIMEQRIETVHGTHWGQRSYDWYSDDLASTLLAYSIIKGDSIYGKLLPSVKRYILFQKRGGYYRNTASSGLVLTTILPELLAKKPLGDSRKATYVRISGSVKDSVTSFPKTYAVKGFDPRFSFTKSGISPVYVSVVYDYFNTRPEPRDSSFRVRTHFVTAKADTLTSLKAGQKITLRTTVTCLKEMEYIMIEVPIPAGCIQVDKDKSKGYNEAAREHFKDQTDIFCNRLSRGTYTFDITLEARYRGSFNVSPARAGMMYYPEEYGHTGVKRVRIQ